MSEEQTDGEPQQKREFAQSTVEISVLQITSVSTEFTPDSISHAIFLTVENASSSPIPKVYAKIVESKIILDSNERHSLMEPTIPKQANLAWRSGGIYRNDTS